MFDYVMGAVQNAARDPLAIVGVVQYKLCDPTIKTPLNGFPAAACLVLEIMGQVADIADDFHNLFKKESWQIKQDFCSQVLKNDTNTNQNA